MALSNKVTGLSSGYVVAESDLGKLRLPTRKEGEEGAMLKPSVPYHLVDNRVTRKKQRKDEWDNEYDARGALREHTRYQTFFI